MINPITLYKWAERRFGKSRCLKVVYRNNNQSYFGEYNFEERIIKINLRHVRSYGTLYRTMAHEWSHAQQSEYWYFKLLKKYGYKNHPYEIMARNREKKI